MIYAIIIIVALAIAFVILIRRLPQAIDLVDSPTPESPKQEKQPIRFTLPKLPTLPTIPSKEAKTEVLPPTEPMVAAAATPAKPAWQLPKFSLPKISLPERKRSAAGPTNESQPEETATAAKEFWADLQETKPVSEPVSTTSRQEKPAKPFQPKAKNLGQEADDLFAIKDYRKAEKLYLKLAAEDPKNQKIYSRLGIIYLEQKNYEDARDAFQQAIRLEPGVASRHFNLAIAYLNLGSTAKAVQALEQALKHDPANRKYRKMLDDVRAGRI